MLLSGSSEYRGPILINPGGPGGSGVDAALIDGHTISRIVGPQFDIVGFDPRGALLNPLLLPFELRLRLVVVGVGHTTPRVSFFETDAEQALWMQDLSARGSLNASEDALPRAWARAQITGQMAAKRDRGALKHVTTDVVARDMLRINQAYGRDKIQYWGFS